MVAAAALEATTPTRSSLSGAATVVQCSPSTVRQNRAGAPDDPASRRRGRGAGGGEVGCDAAFLRDPSGGSAVAGDGAVRPDHPDRGMVGRRDHDESGGRGSRRWCSRAICDGAERLAPPVPAMAPVPAPRSAPVPERSGEGLGWGRRKRRRGPLAAAVERALKLQTAGAAGRCGTRLKRPLLRRQRGLRLGRLGLGHLEGSSR